MSDTSDSREVATTQQFSLLRDVFDPDLDFRKLALEVQYFAKGFSLVPKSALIGIPFIVVQATYREGFLRDKVKGDYVSLECVVADKETLNSAFVRVQRQMQFDDEEVPEIAVYGNQPIIFNDGSTGVRREITKHLAATGAIDVGGNKDDDRRWDRPFSMWASGADDAQYGFEAYPTGEPFRYFAIRGLRKSVYENEFTAPGKPATTYYFA